jgi:hypothetical protein
MARWTKRWPAQDCESWAKKSASQRLALAYLGMFIQVEKCYKTFMSSDSNRTDGEILGRAWWLTLKVSSLSEMIQEGHN